jgi:hypothetical protein
MRQRASICVFLLALLPTTIFVGRDGKVRRVHSGFAGPATGNHHRDMVGAMESVLKELTAEPAPAGGPGA